jgi:tRNA(Met) cytidine acetyltransferase
MNADNNTQSASDLPTKSELESWAKNLGSALRSSGQRLVLVCRGDIDWLYRIPLQIPEFHADVVFSDNPKLTGAIPFAQAETRLGLEAGCVVYDRAGGFNADVLCMAAGLVRAGGLLLVLTPQQRINDPYGCWQDGTPQQVFFIERLESLFAASQAVIEWKQHGELPLIPPLPVARITPMVDGASAQQSGVLLQLDAWMRSNTRCFVLMANRGRGKSSVLGLFAARQVDKLSLVVTAASRRQAMVLLKMAATARAEPCFLAPDEIVRGHRRLALLLIDEAAMLPHNLLWQLMQCADKVILATTTGGYEGTGQGFMLKFLARLREVGYIESRLDEPLRWGGGDVVEELLDETLLLQPQTAADKFDDAPDIAIRRIERHTLASDETLLRSVYGLLVRAHYRTRPSDLRQLMEDDNLQLLVAFAADAVVGVLLMNHEGGFDPALCEQVFLGRRRPRGHLFAQMITAQAGIREFATLAGGRIQRVSVHEARRRHGVGRALVEAAEALAREQGLVYLGSSFALDAETAPFWRKLDFRLLHIGSGSGKSTGRQAVAVMRPFNAPAERWGASLEQRFQANLPLWLLSYCNDLDWPEVLSLIEWLDYGGRLDALELDEVQAFCEGFRGLDLSLAALQRLLLLTLAHQPVPDQRRLALLVQRILLNHDWDRLRDAGLPGKKALLGELRAGIADCYHFYTKAIHD